MLGTVFKHKHKKEKWITTGIIKSIRYRDKLYKKLKETHVNTPEYTTIKCNIKTYNCILKKSIRLAKSKYFEKCFDENKNDMKKHGSQLMICFIEINLEIAYLMF